MCIVVAAGRWSGDMAQARRTARARKRGGEGRGGKGRKRGRTCLKFRGREWAAPAISRRCLPLRFAVRSNFAPHHLTVAPLLTGCHRSHRAPKLPPDPQRAEAIPTILVSLPRAQLPPHWPARAAAVVVAAVDDVARAQRSSPRRGLQTRRPSTAFRPSPIHSQPPIPAHTHTRTRCHSRSLH